MSTPDDLTAMSSHAINELIRGRLRKLTVPGSIGAGPVTGAMGYAGTSSTSRLITGDFQLHIDRAAPLDQWLRDRQLLPKSEPTFADLVGRGTRR